MDDFDLNVLVDILTEMGGIKTVFDYEKTDSELGNFVVNFLTYGADENSWYAIQSIACAISEFEEKTKFHFDLSCRYHLSRNFFYYSLQYIGKERLKKSDLDDFLASLWGVL